MSKTVLEEIAEKEGLVVCPVCNGMQLVEKPNSKLNAEVELKRQAAVTLINNGYGVRQTQRLLGFKSPQSVQKIKDSL